MPLIEINGKKIEAEAGSMIIEVADLCHVQIPRFCYHKKLSIAANCRMCLVEVEKAPKPLPACATPVTEGMKIWTQSPKALLAQKSVMEFLLINHPLDCPICDQGGECELQDLSMGYGADESRYTEGKRVVKDKDIGPLIATNMTRCIHCTRCVRFGTEVAGIRELGATGRGECTEIGTFIEQSVVSEVSGNIIDLCPVGALTSKPFEFRARGWELKQSASIAPHDNVGSHIYVQSRRNQVMRIVPRENEQGNETWISDRDRFSYEALNSEDRLLFPKIKRNGKWIQVSWDEALLFVAEELQKIQSQTSEPNQIGALISPSATLEEYYLLQKWLRGIGSNHIDHRLRQQDFRHDALTPLFPSLGISIAEIEKQSMVLLIGSNIRKEQPILGLKLRKMVQAGGKVCSINPADFDFNFEVKDKTIVNRGELVLGLAGVAKAILNENPGKIATDRIAALAEIECSETDVKIAKQLLQGEKKLILIGMFAISHPAYSQIMVLCQLISELTQAKIGVLTEGANSAGAWIAGCVPHRLPGGRNIENPGLNASEIWEKNVSGYVLFNIEPDFDCIQGVKTLQTLQNAKCVVAITPYESISLREVATVMLPLCPYTENSGTYVNVAGQWQSFKAAVPFLGESRPGWKILRVLGNLCGVAGFDQQSSEEVLVALQEEMGRDSALEPWKPGTLNKIERIRGKNDIVRIAPIPIYACDGTVRRANSLQQTQDAGENILYLNTQLSIRLKLTEGRVRVNSEGMSLSLPYLIDDTVPENTVIIPACLEKTIALGKPYAIVEIEGV